MQDKHQFDACYIAWFADSVKPVFLQAPSATPMAMRLAQTLTDRFATYNKLGGYVSYRSYEPITKADLRRLGQVAAIDRADLFRRKPETGRLYSDRLFAVALCQGGALHYLDGKNGIKDLDVWSFFKPNPKRQYPYRRRAQLDFGDTKFGQSEDTPNFVGRRVDHIGRAIPASDYSDPVAVLRHYLRTGATESARRLSEKAVVLIEPAHLLGTVVWPESPPSNSFKPNPLHGSA